jgi:hypothetical protein
VNRAWSLSIALFALAAVSCGPDPVHSDAVAALGPEQDGVAPGPTHRPGQPCLTCHGGSGPADKVFSVAGTIFRAQNEDPPVGIQGAKVVLVDSTGTLPLTDPVTNEVGNFYIAQSDWTPVYPLRVRVDYKAPKSGAYPVSPMTSIIGRDGSCAGCHKLTPDPATDAGTGPSQPGFIYIATDKADPGLQ